jgi:hypothetical protein
MHGGVASVRVVGQEWKISEDTIAPNTHTTLVAFPKVLENRNRALLANAIPTSDLWKRPRSRWHTDERVVHQNGARILSWS